MMPALDHLGSERLARYLFAAPDVGTFAVLDGASVPDLRMHLFEDEPEHVCLFRGELTPDMAEVAPYLIKLDPHDRFTQWLLHEGWGEHWGVFVVTQAGLRSLRTHLRSLLWVRDADGRELFFRYYDPRVLETFLPTCDGEQLDEFFGPAAAFLFESGPETDRPAGAALVRAQRRDGDLETERVVLTEAPT
jgi:hypothetical protein